MGRLVSQGVKDQYQRLMREVVSDLGRKVLIYKQPAKADCPNCFYEKMTDSSTGKCRWTLLEARDKQSAWLAAGNDTIMYKYFIKGRCPVCLGKGVLEVDRKVWVNALINWDPSGNDNSMITTPAGTEGSTIVLLKTDPKYFETFKNCKKLIVDGVECKISRPPILRGLGNQTLLIVTAFTTEKPAIDSTEIIKDYT